MDISRASLVSVFTALRAAEGEPAGESYAEIARLQEFSDFSEELVIVALAVFKELELVDFSDGRIRLMRGKKTELTNSRIYREALRLIEQSECQEERYGTHIDEDI